jgi:hypothetical protein
VSILLGLTEDGKLYIRRSDLERLAERLGSTPEELAERLGAREEPAGRGSRFVLDDPLGFLLSKVLEVEARLRRLEEAGGMGGVKRAEEGAMGDARRVGPSEFEEALRWAYSQARGPTGYAPIRAIMRLVSSKLGLSEAQFAEALAAFAEANRGRVLLLQGGDEKVYIGGRAYGYIKLL